ncbi:MAG: Bug family tripartite tricarboxylate transporter substrate binding protein [Burkholderiaceae bacterium]
MTKIKCSMDKLLILCLSFWVCACLAQPYPNKPIRLIVQYPPGGAIDVLARNVAQKAASTLGQAIVIENKPGASGLIAFEACAKSPADGYHLCLATGEGLSFNPFMFAKLPYDPSVDFVAVIDLVRISGVIVASALAPYDTMAGLLEQAKRKPGSINWASFGTGSNPHIYLNWISNKAKVDMVHVPYKGSAQTVPALISGESDVTYVALGFVLPLIKSGKLKALAVTTPKRLPQLPNTPTLAELGLDTGTQNWVGIVAPAQTPMAIVNRLNAVFAKEIKDAALIDGFLAVQAFDPVGASQEDSANFIKADRLTAQRVVQLTGIKLDSSN